jgi:hypothetical protein
LPVCLQFTASDYIFDNFKLSFRLRFFVIVGGVFHHDRMVVGFTTAYEINAYHFLCCEF